MPSPSLRTATNLKLPPILLNGLLLTLMASGPIAFDISAPSLPAIAGAFQTSDAMAQLVLIIFLFGFAPAQLFVGALADQVGRRPVLLGGLSIFVLASVVCAAAPTIEVLLLARFVQAMGVSVGAVLSRVIVRDIYGKERATEMLAYLGAVMALAPGFAPFLGAGLQAWFGWQSAFVLLILLGVGLWLVVLVCLPETLPTSHEPSPNRLINLLTVYATLLHSPAYRTVVVSLGSSFAGFLLFWTTSPFLFITLYEMPVALYGFVSLTVTCGYVVGGVTVGRLSRFVSQRRLILVGFGTLLWASLLLLFIAWIQPAVFWWLVLPMAFYMVGYGMVVPTITIQALNLFPQRVGAAAALLGCSEWLLAALIGLVVTGLIGNNPLTVALATLVAAGTAFAVYLLPATPTDSESEAHAGDKE